MARRTKENDHDRQQPRGLAERLWPGCTVQIYFEWPETAYPGSPPHGNWSPSPPAPASGGFCVGVAAAYKTQLASVPADEPVARIRGARWPITERLVFGWENAVRPGDQRMAAAQEMALKNLQDALQAAIAKKG